MAKWENFAGFDIVPQDNFYCYWPREDLEVQASPSGYHHDSWYEQPQSSFSLPCYSYVYTADGNGPSLPSMHETNEPQSGPWVMPEILAFFEETTAPSEDHDEDTLGDPNLHLDIEELNKEFMAKSEEVYDSLMSCHWQPLDTVYSNIPEENPK